MISVSDAALDKCKTFIKEAALPDMLVNFHRSGSDRSDCM